MWGLTKKNFKWNMAALAAMTALAAAWQYFPRVVFGPVAILIVSIPLVLWARHRDVRRSGAV